MIDEEKISNKSWQIKNLVFSYFRKNWNIYIRFKKNDLFKMAASVSFYAFLSLFPFFLVLLYFSALVFRHTAAIDNIHRYLRVFPAAVSDVFQGNLESIYGSGQVISLISFIFLLYFAFKVFDSLGQALDTIYGTEVTGKPWQAKLKAFSFFLLTSFILTILLLSGSAIVVLATTLEKIPLISSYFVVLIGYIILETLFFSFSYKYFSHRKLRNRDALVGGLVAAISWEILKTIFGIYIANIGRYSLIYGSIGSIILLQLWLYYSILVYLFGAQISAGFDH